jgi:hypothetical protein
VDVVAAREIRWQEQGRIDNKKISLFSTLDQKRGQVVMGQDLLHMQYEEKLSFFLSSLLVTGKLRLRGKFSNITLILTYAPTEYSPDAIKH